MMLRSGIIIILLYCRVSKGLETNKFKNLIGNSCPQKITNKEYEKKWLVPVNNTK